MDIALQRRALLICATLVGLLSLLSFRLVYVQVVRHQDYLTRAEDYYLAEVTVPATRGIITDRYGEPLAMNQIVYTLEADRYHLAERRISSQGVARAEGLDVREVRRRYSQEEIKDKYLSWMVNVLSDPLETPAWQLRKYIDETRGANLVLARGIEEDLSRQIQSAMDDNDVGGVYLRAGTRRFYPYPEALTHVTGFVNGEGEGKAGIEAILDEEMKGKDGVRYIERDNRKREIVAFRHQTRLPRDGNNVRLTVDMALQCDVEEIIQEANQLYQPEKITAIVMDPNTAEVLAIASRPHYDLRNPTGNWRNVAISDRYEPGSTFKIVALSAALERDLVSLNTEIFCHWGNYQEGKLHLRDHHPYGELTVAGVLAKSSNIGIYKIARQLGADSFHDYMRAFGFGSETGVGLTGENSGMIKPVSDWSGTSFSSMAMGYEVAVTPIQMITALSAIANGGELLKPRIIADVTSPDGKVIHKTGREVVRRVISERTAELVRMALEDVISDYGTGERAAVEGYRVAGKTGTAKKYSVPRGCYLDGHYVVSFMGFLPADDPKVAVLVMVDDPKAEDMQLYGGTVAAPIFADIMRRAVKRLRISSTLVTTSAEHPDAPLPRVN